MADHDVLTLTLAPTPNCALDSFWTWASATSNNKLSFEWATMRHAGSYLIPASACIAYRNIQNPHPRWGWGHMRTLTSYKYRY